MDNHIIFLNGIWPTEATSNNTNFTRSISCYQLKHWISHFGFRSQVIDFCQMLSVAEIEEMLSRFISKTTLAIGVSATFWPRNTTPENIKEIVKIAKERWPNLKIIAGGARRPPTDIEFDRVFIGESEDQFLVWCQEAAGKLGRGPFNKKFDITSLDHRFTENDGILEGEALPLELGRGCVFKCKFCAHQNLGKPKYTYQRRHELIVDEICYNKEKFNTSKYMLLDDTVNEDLDKIRNLYTIKESTGIDIEWTGYLRADLIWSKPESVDLLIGSGLRSCFFGIETFHPAAGKSIDKGWGAKQGKKYLPHLHKNLWGESINIHVNLIAGLPGESIDSLRSSLEWCLENDIGYHRFVPLTLYTENDDENASSEFTKNYKSYGYTDVTDGFWRNGSMTSDSAAKFCNTARLLLAKSNRVSSWDLFNLTNLDVDTRVAMSWNENRIPRAAELFGPVFKDRYLGKLRNLS